MILNKNIKFTIALIFFLLVSIPNFAQVGEEAPEDEDAPNAAPISDYVVPMFVIGVATAFILLRKKEVKV